MFYDKIHFMLVAYDLGYSIILDPKNHTRKVHNTHKDFELFQVFKRNFLCQNVRIFLLYILLTRRIDAFWSRGIDKFWSGGIETYWV